MSAPEQDPCAPTTSIIVPARNAARTLGACLQALHAQIGPARGVEVIVVDDGSIDATAQVARQGGARVVGGPATGPAGARNAGIRAAKGELLLFLDADTVPEHDWLTQMRAPFADPRVVAVKGRYRTEQRSLLGRFSQLEFEWKYGRLERAATIDYVDTGTAAFRREALARVGDFDESLRTNEDVELAYRLSRIGGQIVFNPDAVVLHSHTDDLPGYFLKKLRAGYTRTLVYERHPDKALGDAYTPPLMAAQIGLAGLLPVALLGRALGWGGRAWQLIVALFAASTYPVLRRALAKDPGVAPVVPIFALVRAFAQGLGIAAALGHRLTRPWVGGIGVAGSDQR